jgi:hypothetical protein
MAGSQCPSAKMTESQKPILIDFCDFWPGFRKTDNFFYRVLKQRFSIELADQPDFLIYSNPESHFHRLHNCVKIYFGVESFLPDWNECDYALTCHYLDDPRHLRLPYYSLYGNAEFMRKDSEDLEKILASKTRFCTFVVSNAGKRKTQKRVDFFHQLSKRKHVDSGGRAFNNIGGPIAGGPPAKLEFLRTGKFNIAFENASIPGYTTEKLVEAFWARTLPIYWGNPLVSHEFNPKSFLNLADFPSDEALIERIMELDKDDSKYLEVLRQPCFHNNEPNEFYESNRILDFFDKIFNANIRPVSQRQRFFFPSRWVFAKRRKPSVQ